MKQLISAVTFLSAYSNDYRDITFLYADLRSEFNSYLFCLVYGP